MNFYQLTKIERNKITSEIYHLVSIDSNFSNERILIYKNLIDCLCKEDLPNENGVFDGSLYREREYITDFLTEYFIKTYPEKSEEIYQFVKNQTKYKHSTRTI